MKKLNLIPTPQYVDYVLTNAGGFNGYLRFDDNLNLVCKGYFDDPVILSAIRISFTLSVQVDNYLNEPPRLWFRSNSINGTLASRDEYTLHAMSSYYTDVLDAYSGYFGGEIRLGYLFDGEKVSVVTGGSVNGSILELGKDMKFSKEMQKEAGFEGPYEVCIDKVSVAGE